MARRRAASSRWLIPVAILAVAGGLSAGVLLGRGPFSRSSVPATPPGTSPSPAVLPQPPEPEIVSIDDAALAAAVRTALVRLGEIAAEAESPQSIQAGTLTLRWHTRRIDVRTRRSLDEAARALVPEVARAGGQVVTRGGTLAIEVVRRGRRLRTHEVRLIRPAATARVAIIFDDAGGSLADLEEIIALHRPVTVAVLPGLRFSREVAERTRAAGLEVFLHLPLEPEDGTKDLGPGGITGAMSEVEIAAAVRAGLDSVPGAVGVNNHMGSKGTADERVMRAVLAVVQERHLIWIDSVTSARTVGGRLAAELGIRTASRQVFLDNADDPDAIRAQLRRLITVARSRGAAVAIGHANRRTPQVLREMLSEFDRAGIEVVPASTLAR